MACVLLSCSTPQAYVPVVDATIQPLPSNGVYRVRRGETLYSIAWRYGMDYRVLAARNHLTPPWHVQKGQVLILRQSKHGLPLHRAPHAISRSVAVSPLPRPVHQRQRHVPSSIVTHREADHSTTRQSATMIQHWRWPAQGAVAAVYSSFNRGINIAGKEGEPVLASAAGEVVYAGNGLRGYGNLIIIRHNALWLSAYAFNQRLRVRQGEWVRAGQPIAWMGHLPGGAPMLHFEIRRAGKPVDPLQYLRHR